MRHGMKYKSIKCKIYTNKKSKKLQAVMYLKKCHISWPSNCFVESAKFIEANDTFLFTFLRIYYLHIKAI